MFSATNAVPARMVNAGKVSTRGCINREEFASNLRSRTRSALPTRITTAARQQVIEINPSTIAVMAITPVSGSVTPTLAAMPGISQT